MKFQSARLVVGSRLTCIVTCIVCVGWGLGGSSLGLQAQTNCSVYSEDFESYPNSYGWGNNGANSGGFDGTEANWSLSGDDNGDYWYVTEISGNKLFEGKDLDGESIWTSRSIDVTGLSSLVFSIDLAQSDYNKMDNGDYIKVYVISDGGTESLLFEQFNDLSGATTETFSISASSTVQFRVKANSNANDERWRFDNLELTASSTDADADGLCDSVDNCTDTSAGNYADPANGACAYAFFHEPFTDASQFTQNVSFAKDGNNDYWGIYDIDGSTDDFGGSSAPGGVPAFGGIDGNILVGEDMNDDGVQAVPGILTWSNIDISNYGASLLFQIDIAEDGASADEYVELYAKLSSDAGYTLLIDPGANIGNIGSTLTTQSASGTFDGTSLDLQLKFYSDDGGDHIAVDDLRVLGVSNCTAVTVTASNATVDLASNGEITVSASDFAATASGDCFTSSSIQVSKDNTTFSSSLTYDCAESGTQSVYLRATDGTSFGSSTSVDLTVQDVSAPTATAQDITVALDATGNASITAGQIDNGSADNCSVASTSLDVSTFDCSHLGANTVTLTVTDPSGNADAATAEVTVEDNIAPVVSTPSGTYNLGSGSGSSTGNVVIYFGTAIGWTDGYSDNCTADGSIAKLVSKTGTDWGTASNSVTFDCSELGLQTVYLRATDASGNETTVSGSITIADNTAPTITGISSTSAQLSAGSVTVTASSSLVTAADDCAAAGELTYTLSTSSEGTYTATLDFGCADIGSQTLYFKAEDPSGNLSSAFSASFTISDATGLQAIGQDVTVSLDAEGNYTLSGSEVNNGSIGNCNTSLTVSPSSFDCADIGVNEVTLTIGDGTVSDATTVNVTVEDNLAPNVTAMPSVSVNLGSDGTASILPGNAAVLGNPADRCTPNEDLTFEIKREGGTYGSSVAIDCDDLGASSFNVVVTAIDDYNNVYESGNIPVNVSDVTAPIISSITSGLSEILSSAGLATIDASSYVSATDNCTTAGGLSFEISESIDSGFAPTFVADCGDLGDKTFYFRVKDASGNMSSVGSEVITIVDGTSPVAQANAVTLLLIGGTATLSASDGTFNTSSDACGISVQEVKLTSEGDGTYASSLDFESEGDYDVTLRVSDASGNSATSTATITVVFQMVNGCMDLTACNYDNTATSDDGSCHFPGEECQSPAAGQGFVYTVNGAGDGCDCTAQDFEQVYFEDFGPGGEAGGQGFGYGYDGYTDVDGDGSLDEDNAGAETAWSWASSDPNVGNGTTEGTEADYWTTVNVTNGGISVDTVFDGLYLVNEYTWTTKALNVEDYSHVRVQAEITEDGTMESDDYIKVRLIEDGVPAGSTLGEVVDDSPTPFPEYTAIDLTQATSAEEIQVRVEALNNASGEYHTFDDVEISAWGKPGCTDPNAATGYDATAQVDDGSCLHAFATAYSTCDGGFKDKIWVGTSCGGDCGTGPFLDAKKVDAEGQTSSTSYNYVISSGTTVTVNGTTDVDGDPTTKDMFVRNLTVEAGGKLVIPFGKRLRVMGEFVDLDGDAISGLGMLRIDGEFQLSASEGSPAEVNVVDFELPEGGELVVPEGRTLRVNGDLVFRANAPSVVSGLLKLTGSDAQVISGSGATFDDLEIANTSSAGVSMSDDISVNGRLTIGESAKFDAGTSYIRFVSDGNSGGLLDAVPNSADFIGSGVGRSAANQSQATAVRAEVERYIAPDDDGVTFNGFTMFASSIDGLTVGDLDGINGFYLAGWPGTNWPNTFPSVQFWDESTGTLITPSSNDDLLAEYGGCWIAIGASQSPTMLTSGALTGHKLGTDSKTFTVTRSGPDANMEGWNLVFNPYQGRLDWHRVMDAAYGNGAVIEDQYSVYDTQLRRHRRYGTNFSGVDWADAGEQTADVNDSLRYINPGQSFWVRVADGVSSGTFTLKPEMIHNYGDGTAFIRSAQAGVVEVILESENVFGATRTVLRFSESGDMEGYVQGDMSFLESNSVKAAEMAFIAEGQHYVGKHLPTEAFDGELFVRSRANFPTTMRVVEILGEPEICAHIVDNETGEVMVLEEGEEISFVLPATVASEGRFTLHSVPFGRVEGLSPECPDSEEGMIVMELGEAVADLTVTDYSSMEVVSTLYQQTGTVEMPIAPGEYAIMMLADEETTLCRGGRRQVQVAPGEQPELLGVDAMPAECNEGMASLAFELYGAGSFETALMQGNEEVWSETLEPGEHTLTDIVPGDYILKVDHTCLQDFEWVSLWDEDMSNVQVEIPSFIETEQDGGAWIEAECVGCTYGEGYGYYWLLDGEWAGENEPLGVRVDTAGVYTIEWYTYGLACDEEFEAEVAVGKFLLHGLEKIEWLGIQGGQLGVRFPEAWRQVSFRWLDATGRWVKEGTLSQASGEVFMDVPQMRGWTTLELRSSEGKTVRWVGIL